MSQQSGNSRWSLLLLLIASAILRVAVIWHDPGPLYEDRDQYLGIARNIAEGNGFSAPGTNTPTAFRPPLYPMLIAGLFRLGFDEMSIGAMQVVLGTLTVWLTFVLATRLGLGKFSLLAAGFVAVDPLLLRYTAMSMTEITTTFLTTLLLVLLSNRSEAHRVPVGGDTSVSAKTPAPGMSPIRQLLVGVVFGATALCRPTMWAFAALAGLVWLFVTIRTAGISPVKFVRVFAHRMPWLTLLAVSVTVAPWPIRNWQLFHAPILTTTHGGYTLLLGNNNVFYNEVVSVPWGPVLDANTLAKWQESLEREMATSPEPVVTEVQRDRWMYAKAWDNITVWYPRTFVKACWVRFCRFWNIRPMGPEADALPIWAQAAVGAFYALVLVGMMLGAFRIRGTEWRQWTWPALLIVSFCLVHLVYWSNTRMRAPVIPAICLFSARGLGRFRREDTPESK